MSEMGLVVKHDAGSTRIGVQCKHQNGLLYVVPSEANWVCTEDLLHAHSLAGFFKQLCGLNDPKVKELMQRWGIYFRDRPLADQPDNVVSE